MPSKVTPLKAQEKIDADLRKLSRLEGNRTCVDCPEKMPGYVNLTHRTFVCIKCSGIHRELQFKIKGISMSVFTADDVASMSSGGNIAHNLLYMDRFHAAEYTLPNGSDVGKLRDFIKRKYNEKKWYTDETSRVSKAAPSSSSASSFTEIDPWGVQKSNALFASKIKDGAASNSSSFGIDLMSMSPSTPTSTTTITDNFKGGFDPFGFEAPSIPTPSGIKNPGSSGSYGHGSMYGQSSVTEMPQQVHRDNLMDVDTGRGSSAIPMEFDAFNSPMQQQAFYSPPATFESKKNEVLKAVESIPQHQMNYSAFDRSAAPSSVPSHLGVYLGSPQRFPIGHDNYAVDPGSYSQHPLSANPFDIPTGPSPLPTRVPVPVQGGTVHPFGAHMGPGNPFGHHIPNPNQPLAQHPYPSYPVGMPYYTPRGQVLVQGPVPGLAPGLVQGHMASQHYPYQYQQHIPPGSLPYNQVPPHFVRPGMNAMGGPMSPGQVHVPVQTAPDPFSSVSALSWGLAGKPIGPVTTPQGVTYSPHPTPHQIHSHNEAHHMQLLRQGGPSPQAAASGQPPNALVESTNPFDLF